VNAIRQYEEYLEWLRAKYLEISRDRALFWQSAQPYRIDWQLANKYAEMIRFVTREVNQTNTALERVQAQKKTRLRYRAAKLYLKRVVALFVWR